MPQIKLEVIKVPKDFLDPRAIKRALERAYDTAEIGVLTDYESTVATWKKKPHFYSTRQKNTIIVWTDDKIYQYVNYGTSAHLIFPKRARALRFRAGYRAKTHVRVIKAGSGGSFGATRFSKGVIHPGTEARNFDQEISKKWDRVFPQIVDDELSRVL